MEQHAEILCLYQRLSNQAKLTLQLDMVQLFYLEPHDYLHKELFRLQNE